MITPTLSDTSQYDNQPLPETTFQIESEPIEVNDIELVDDDIESKDIMLTKRQMDILKEDSDSEIKLPIELFDDIEIESLDYVDPSIIELATDMMNAVFLELWSIDLLLEGEIQGEHFTKVFETYRGRFDECISQRDYMLNKVQDIESKEQKIKEATVELAELEIRKTLNDLKEGEYDSLTPALEWKIQYFEKDVENRKGTINLLNNLTNLMPDYRILEMKVKAENTKRTLNDMDISQTIGVRTAEKVKSSLDDILSYLGED